MTRIITLLTLAFTCAAGAADILPKNYHGMVKHRRVCVARDIIVLNGVTNIVTHWQRNGKPDWLKPAVETNAIKRIKGIKQNNALENARQAAEVEAAPVREIKAAAKHAAKKDAKIFNKEIKSLEKARDKSTSEAFKNLYQRTIDLWLSEVNGK